MDKNKSLSPLERYLEAKRENKDLYMDTFEIETLLNYLEDNDNLMYYEEIVKLGLKLHPGNFYMRLKEARYFMLIEEYPKALRYLAMLRHEDPYNEDIELYSIECHCRLGNLKEVARHLNRLEKEDDPVLEEALECACSAMNDDGYFDSALEWLVKAFNMFPDNLFLHHELCFALESTTDFPTAVKICEEHLNSMPYDYKIWFILGRLYAQLDEYEKAIEAFDFAETSKEPNAELKVLRAYCLYMNGSYERAINEYEELLDDEDSKYIVAPLLAECYFQQEQFDRAYRLLSDLVKNDSDLRADVNIYISYIQSCFLTDNNKEGMAAIQTAKNLFKDNIHFLCFLAGIALEEKDEASLLAYIKHLSFCIFRPDAKSEDNANALLALSKKLARTNRYSNLAWNLNSMAIQIHPFPQTESSSSEMLDKILLNSGSNFPGDIQPFEKMGGINRIDANVKRLFNEGFREKDIPTSLKENHIKMSATAFIKPINLAYDFINDKNNCN